MSDEIRHLEDIHAELAGLLAERIEGELEDLQLEEIGYVLVVLKHPSRSDTEELGGGLASNCGLLAPLALASSLAGLCQPSRLISIVDGSKLEPEDDKGDP